jgi:hypothetical protein
VQSSAGSPATQLSIESIWLASVARRAQKLSQVEVFDKLRVRYHFLVYFLAVLNRVSPVPDPRWYRHSHQQLSMIGQPSMHSLLRDRQRIVLCRGGLAIPLTHDINAPKGNDLARHRRRYDRCPQYPLWRSLVDRNLCS